MAENGAAAKFSLRSQPEEGAVVVSLQKGLHNPRNLRAALSGHTVLAGMVPYNMVGSEPGTVHQGMRAGHGGARCGG
ncbi:2-dehydropantoate 2-reductase N-terminal domain-containing protein [Streptomyces niveus]